MRAPCGFSYVRGMTEIASTESSTELQASPPSAAWLRILALVYDPFLWLGEIAGMRRRRSTLLGGARGRVVEIGAGTGLNIAHYPDGIAELVLTEPEPGMRRRLARRLQRHGRSRADRRRARGAPTAGRCVRGHRRLDARPLHRQRPRTRAARDRTRAPPGWAVAVHRTRACELAVPRGVPGQPAPAVAPLRRRLHLQPPDRGADARLRLRCRSRRRRVARHAARSSIRSWWDGPLGDLDVSCGSCPEAPAGDGCRGPSPWGLIKIRRRRSPYDPGPR